MPAVGPAARPPSPDRSPAPSARPPPQTALLALVRLAPGPYLVAGRAGQAVGRGGRSRVAAGLGAARRTRGSLGAGLACQTPENLAREVAHACRSLCGHAKPCWGFDRRGC